MTKTVYAGFWIRPAIISERDKARDLLAELSSELGVIDAKFESMVIHRPLWVSLAALFIHSSPTAASGGKAVVQKPKLQNPNLNVCFHQERSFKPVDSRDFQRRLTANSGHWRDKKNPTLGRVL